MRYFIFLYFIMVGCCTPSDASNGTKRNLIPINLLYTPIEKIYVEPEFQRYIIDFEFAYKKTVAVPMYFESNLDGKDVGQHWRFTDGYNEIVIEKEYWEKSTILKRRSLIFHELGHHYGEEHRNEMGKDGCPKSIMNENMPSQKCLRKNWKAYEKELFSGRK